jgi:hypothetical protein
MEDRERHRIGISQYQPHINGDVAPQKYRVSIKEHISRVL